MSRPSSDHAPRPVDAIAARRQAFEREVGPHLDAAYRYALVLCRSPEEAEDILQEAALRAYRSVDQQRQTGSAAWLLAIVRNCFVSARRRRGANLPTDTIDGAEVPDPADNAPTPEMAALARADQQQIAVAFGGLSVAHQEILALREVHDLSYRDIARQLDVKVGTVMSRLARARDALRAEWLAHFGSDLP